MDSLRRIYSLGKGNLRPIRSIFKQRPTRMSKAEARLEAALNQLRDGVPLNWTQLEDDPEMVTLARLHAVAQEARSQGLEALPPNLQRNATERMSTRLPRPKQQIVKVAPKSLAGFSENVPVLTQVEENINLQSRVPQWIGATLAAGLLVTFVFWWTGSNFFSPPKSDLTWIEVQQGGKPIYAANPPHDYKAPRCPAWTTMSTSPYIIRNYVPSPDKNKAQGDVDFPIEYLPESVIVGNTAYTLTYLDTAIAACEGPGAVRYSNVMLAYIAKWNTGSGQVKLGTMSVFEGRRQVMTVDAAQGKWKSVTIGDHKGVLWQGAPYKDTSGFDWFGDTIVLAIEHDDITTTVVGQASNGITEEMLAGIIKQMTKAPTAQPASQYTKDLKDGTPIPGILLPIRPDPNKAVTK